MTLGGSSNKLLLNATVDYQKLRDIMNWNWTWYLIELLGYEFEENIAFQDNRISINMEEHGKSSCSKQMKHIRVRYFFIKDNK